VKVSSISKFITQLSQIMGRKLVYISLFKSLLFLTSNYSHAVVTTIGGVGTADIPATWSTSVSGDALTAHNFNGSVQIKFTYIASQPDYWTGTSPDLFLSVLDSQLDRMERDRIKEWLDLDTRPPTRFRKSKLSQGAYLHQ
jgi:hypothetical protein